ILGRIDHDAGADRLSRLRRAAAPRRDRHAMPRGNLNDAHNVFSRARDHDSRGVNLVDTRVSRIQRARYRVEADFAGDVLFKIAAKRVVRHLRFYPQITQITQIEHTDTSGAREAAGPSGTPTG